jgi:hypothetical protein
VIPETRYARTVDGFDTAYQVLGEGLPDILMMRCGTHAHAHHMGSGRTLSTGTNSKRVTPAPLLRSKARDSAGSGIAATSRRGRSVDRSTSAKLDQLRKRMAALRQKPTHEAGAASPSSPSLWRADRAADAGDSTVVQAPFGSPRSAGGHGMGKDVASRETVAPPL